VVVKVRIDSKRNLTFPTFHKACETNLAELLAHEMIHCLQANRYGMMKFNPFSHPVFWKLEGYPEYISRHTEISEKGNSLSNDIDRYLNLISNATDIWIADDKAGCDVPNYYYKGRLMIEYLMDIRNFSYDKILSDTISENEVFNEMIVWKENTERKK
jgi:hypothetical protein